MFVFYVEQINGIHTGIIATVYMPMFAGVSYVEQITGIIATVSIAMFVFCVGQITD